MGSQPCSPFPVSAVAVLGLVFVAASGVGVAASAAGALVVAAAATLLDLLTYYKKLANWTQTTQSGDTRNCQGMPGETRGCQEKPGGTRRAPG